MCLSAMPHFTLCACEGVRTYVFARMQSVEFHAWCKCANMEHQTRAACCRVPQSALFCTTQRANKNPSLSNKSHILHVACVCRVFRFRSQAHAYTHKHHATCCRCRRHMRCVRPSSLATRECEARARVCSKYISRCAAYMMLICECYLCTCVNVF